MFLRIRGEASVEDAVEERGGGKADWSVRTGERERAYAVPGIGSFPGGDILADRWPDLSPNLEFDGVDRLAKTHSVSSGRQRKFDSAPRGIIGERGFRSEGNRNGTSNTLLGSAIRGSLGADWK